MPAAWSPAPSWSSISTIRISIATPTPSKCSLAASAERRALTRMRANSLALRLFVTATLWTVVILFGTAILLSSLYRQAVERSFDHRLSVYLRSLVADVASPDVSSERFPQSLGEPLFELPLSGWYWQVTRLDGNKDV